MKTDESKFKAQQEQLDIPVVSRSWWRVLSEDDQMWIMMKCGFEKFNPKNVTSEQIQKLYTIEHS